MIAAYYAYASYAIYAAIAVAILVLAYGIYTMMGQEVPGQEPQELGFTEVGEGSVVPVIYGTVRLPGTLVYYGNIITEEITTEVSGGSGGSQDVVSGYRYYCDCWQVIGHGKLTINSTYKNDKLEDIVCASAIFNDGTTTTDPAFLRAAPNNLEFANPILGIANIAYQRWHIGDNVGMIPTIHFVVTRTITDTTIDYANMTSGNNPAAVIYELMTNKTFGSGISTSKINLTNFNLAAAWFYAKNQGLNFSISDPKSLSDTLALICGWVACNLYQDSSGLWCIQVYNPNEASVKSLIQEDFIDFTFQRPSWSKTFNEIRADWIASNENYAIKTVVIRDPANMRITQAVNSKKVDMRCYLNRDVVDQRMWEIMKSSSYPAIFIEFKTNISSSTLIHIGSVITVSHDYYGFSNLKFRVTSIKHDTIDKNEIAYEATQMVESVLDASFSRITPAVVYWTEPQTTPVNAPHSAILEAPWNRYYERDTAFALAVHRGSQETSFQVWGSPDGSSYSYMGVATSFSQQGVLVEAYPSTTYDIDDERGVLYRPHSNYLAPEELTRPQLFTRERFLLIGSEIMKFQYHIPGQGGTFRMLGVSRGMWNTTIGSHSIGAEVWIMNLRPDNNFVQYNATGTIYVKFLPQYGSSVLPIASATARNVTVTEKAKVVQPPAVVQAVRSGSTVTLTWWPVVQNFIGAGDVAETASNDSWPFNFDGDFEYQKNSDTAISGYDSCQLVITDAAQFTFKVRQRIETSYSAWTTTLTVAVGDGTYISEIGLVSY